MSRRGKVLLVEDDLGIREALLLTLEIMGFEVAAAAHGREALELLRSSGPPGVILLDLMMPVMDGWAFAEEIDRDPALRTVPIVAVTACSDLAPVKNVRGIMKKPIDLDELRAVVTRYCGAT